MPTLWRKNTQIVMFGDNSKEYDLTKLKAGYTFKLYKINWEIIEVGQYDWRMDNTSVEYAIISNDKKAFLEVEFTKGKYEVTYSEAITINDSFLIDAIRSKQIIYDNKLFNFDQSYYGDYKNLTTHSNRESLESFLFYSSDDQLLTIEKWGDNTYETFLGEELKAKKIKNIKGH